MPRLPLRVTGTPKELDEELPRQLAEFVETHLALSSSLKSAKEQRRRLPPKQPGKQPRNQRTRNLVKKRTGKGSW